MQDWERVRGEQGTSLVEVVITLAILVTLASAFAATARNMAPGYRWKQGTREVVETLREARQFAIAKNRTVEVRLTADQMEVVDVTGGNITFITVTLPQGVKLVDDVGNPIVPKTVTFSPQSTVSGPTALQVLAAGHAPGEAQEITLVLATGRVRAK